VSQSQASSAPRGRLDHLLPQGYLEGFTNPSSPGDLCVYDIHRQRWFETGVARVAAIKGFYDYSAESEPEQTPDEAFKEFEDRFPNVRRELIAGNFSGWEKHLVFLLRYAQMLRTRSELFRKHALADVRGRSMFRVTEVFQDPATGKTAARVEPLVETGDTLESLLRNMTITTMRGEIAKGPALFSDLDWCLRLTTEVADPVITGDDAIIVDGKAATLEVALFDRQTLFFFPVCWQACLIGSRKKFNEKTAAFHPADLKTLRSRYLKGDCRFAYAPTKIAV
jgi:hypothetical protein